MSLPCRRLARRTAEAAVPSNNVFPIASPGAACNDDFGVPRPGGRTHQGVDCYQESSRGKPLVAVESGTMRTYSTVNPSDRCAGSGNAVQLVGDSGTWILLRPPRPDHRRLRSRHPWSADRHDR
ncbi:MAG: hypothetical protein WKF58_07005 [Ilumatobacteraceae bacterium]